MNKYITYLGMSSISLFGLGVSGVFSATEIPQISCEYSGKFEQCMIANQNGSARSITEFSCLQSNDPAAVLDQIILDVKFREIQDEKLEFLKKLQDDKQAVVTDQNRLIDDITKNFGRQGVYFKQYKSLCDSGILAERVSCTEKIANTDAGRRIRGSAMTQGCMALANTHLDIYTQVSYDILKLNKSAVNQDNKQEYEQEERKKYDEVLSLMLDIVGHMGRLARGVTHWTPFPKK